MPVWWMATALAGPDALSLAGEIVASFPERPSGSSGVVETGRWVADRLEERGWQPEYWNGPASGGLYACKPGRESAQVLFFAHLDSVHADCPGANDNAAAIGALLELAERVDDAPRTVCLAFPDGEEVGLRGSFRLRDLKRFDALDQVVSLDLVGRGTVTHNGLGPPFSAADARALLAAAPADVPWVYRALSHGAPHMERSDHLPWTLHGIPSTHLLARAESGVFWAYHTAADTPDQLQPDTMRATVDTLDAIAHMEPLGPRDGRGEPWFVIPFTTLVVPGFATWALLFVGPVLAGGTVRVPRNPTPWAATGAALAGGVLGMALASLGRPFSATLADPVVVATWAGWATGALLVGGAPGPWLLRIGAVLALLATAALVWLGLPLLALPAAAVGAGLGLVGLSTGASTPSGWGAWLFGCALAVWPAAYLVRPDALRELAFHGLVPAAIWVWAPLFVLLAFPLTSGVCHRLPRNRRAAGLTGAIAVIAVLWAWTSPVVSGIYDRPPMLWP